MEKSEMMSEGELFDKVCYVVCQVCEVNMDGLLNSRDMPYPTCRGLCWHALRIMTNMTYARIATLVGQRGHEFTVASVNTATSKAVNLISTSFYWKQQWQSIKNKLGIKPQKFDGEMMEIVVTLPKEARNKVKIKIVEKCIK